jgi:hypothetical protein
MVQLYVGVTDRDWFDSMQVVLGCIVEGHPVWRGDPVAGVVETGDGR